MKEIEANKQAWDLLSEDHYHYYKKILEKKESIINRIIHNELGDLKNKKLIHLQCNTGADTVSLTRLGAQCTGVDLSPANIFYAKKLASDFNLKINFIESDILELSNVHQEKYDVVFTSEGAIGWMPDFDKWAKTVRSLLKDDGFFYVYDSHPFLLTLDESLLKDNQTVIKYPYFEKKPDVSDTIGGYASETKEATSYFWMYTVSDLINSLIRNGMNIEFFNEHENIFFNMGQMEQVEPGLFQYPFMKGKFPFSFSLKATVKKN